MKTYLRQPTKEYKVNVTLPNTYDSASLDIWLKNILGIDCIEKDSSDKKINQFAYRALLIINALFEASNIPAFYPGKVLSISRDHSLGSRYTVCLEISDIGLIPNTHFISIVNFAFKAVLWMIQNEATPQNKQVFYQSCLKDIINPLRTMTPPGKSRIPVLKTAYSKEIPFMHLGNGVYQLGWGSKSRKIDRSTTDTDSAMAAGISQNKVLSANLLRLGGLPAPIHGVVSEKEKAIGLAKQLQYPIVVKPADLDRGEGVSVNLYTDEDIIQAFDIALNLSKIKQVIIEKQVEGICHRLFIVEQTLLYAVKRLPKSVKADGIRTIKELIDDANTQENKKAPWFRTEIFPNDNMTEDVLEKLGLTFNSIPPQDMWIPLREIESTQWGGRDEDVTALVHPDNLDIALRATKLFGLNVAGIDIITTDISIPWHQSGAIINEVNFAPLLGGGDISKSYISVFFDRFMKGSGRIPIEVFLGCSEQTLETAKLKQRSFEKTAERCYLTTHMRTFNEFGCELYFPSYYGIVARCQALLLNTNVDALVIVIENDEFLHYQIPFDKVSNVHILSETIYSSKNKHEIIEPLFVQKLVKLFDIL